MLKTIDWSKKKDECLEVVTPIGRVVVALHPRGDKCPALEMLVHVAPRRGPDDPRVDVLSGADGSNGVGDGDGVYTRLVQDTVKPEPRPKDFMPPELALSEGFTGKHVILRQARYEGDTVARVLRALSGFGCDPKGRGGKVYGEVVATGEHIETRLEHIARMASPAECEAARARWNNKVNG